jgi:glutamine synthetase
MAENDIVARLVEQGIDTVELGFGDIQGVLRGKRVPLDRLAQVSRSGFAFCLGALAWDIQSEIFPTEIVGWENGYPDGHAQPDLDSLRIVPWRTGAAFVLSDLRDESGGALAISPREVLKSVLARAHGLGLRPQVGVELEFYVLDKDWKTLQEGVQAYSLPRAGELEFFLQDLRTKLKEFGIAVEASHSEYGPGQVELNLVYGDALRAADDALLFKYAAKEVARVHGLRASFMAKPWTDQSGNGLHIHLSFKGKEGGGNLFATDDALGRRSLAGLLSSIGDFGVLSAPSINSYKRIRDDAFVPTNVSWGGDNRTVAVRSLLGQGEASRLELRTGASDANPYLAVAGAVAGALNGIENQLEPPAQSFGNAVQDPSLRRLPTDLRDALDAWEKSELVSRYFDPVFVRHYLAVGRHEVSVQRQVVTEWERQRYLEGA